MRTVSIAPTILNSKAFMPFGDVVSMEGNQSEYMNDTFSRYSNLAEVDLGDEILSRVNIGLAKCGNFASDASDVSSFALSLAMKPKFEFKASKSLQLCKEMIL